MRRSDPLASRLQGFGTTIFAEMSALAAETGAVNLGQGFPDHDGPSEVADAAIAAMNAGHNQYPPLPGVAELRMAIAEHQERFWSQRVDPDREILVTTGATEAIAAAMLSLCEPGDEVVVFDPTYDCYKASIAMAGAAARPVVLRPDDDGRFVFDREELRQVFSERTRLVLVNTPHNPTGKVFTTAELQQIADLCIEHDVLAITDEVYEHLVFTGTHQLLATFDGMAERTVTISSGGKTFSFTGWKVGWACGPAELIGALRTAKQFLTFVASAPFQPAIATGLRLDDRFFDRFVTAMQAKRDRLTAHLKTAGLTVLEPEGTYFTTVDISEAARRVGAPTDSVGFCLDLPTRAGVVAVPSAVFYADPADGARFIRFCFAKSDSLIDDAGDRLVSAFG